MNGPANEAGAGARSNSSEAPGAEAGEESPESNLAELEDRLLRARADIDNLRKRHAAELRREREAERARVAASLLPVLDNLELARPRRGRPGGHRAGRARHRDQAVQTLAALGYPRDEETGVRFDPNRHEVVAVVEDADAEPNTVTRVVRPVRNGRTRAAAGGCCGQQASGGLSPGGDRLLRRARGWAEREQRGDPAGVPETGPHVPPGRQPGSSCGREVQTDR